MSLESIAAAVAGWSRSNAAAALPDRVQPLDAVLAAWSEIVGPEVAAHGAPLEIVGTTLVIATRSSAWSQQLQFLEVRILAGLRALPAAATIDRLRFRTGAKLAPKERAVAFGRAAPRAPRRARAAYEPARDLEEALARLRARIASRSHVAGDRCDRCAGARQRPPGGLGTATLCAPCAAEATRERACAAQRLLYETPWIGREGILDLVPGLSYDEFDRARRSLLARWWTALERARRSGILSRDRMERRIASSYVILQSRLPPDRISPAIVKNVLGEELAALLFGDPGSATPGANDPVR